MSEPPLVQQSLARRRYNERMRAGSQPIIVDSVSIDPACDWDERAIQNALREASEIEEFDREAASQLRAQAQAAKAKLDGRNAGAAEPLDLMRLYARVLLGYKGGIRDSDFARMDYRRFFGYVRELDIYLQEKAEAQPGPTRSNEAEARAALNRIPKPEEYEGETIRLI